LGNPPYDGFAGVSPVEEQGLVEPYKEGLSEVWGIKKYNLDDLYVRFFRLAERRIAEQSKKRGVVCFISNTSWVREASFVVMRKHLFDSFQKIWIENLHGNRKISEYAPDGSTSETVFAVAGFSPGIQQGVATTLWVKTNESPGCEVFFRDDFNAPKAADRRASMLKALEDLDLQSRYSKAEPSVANRYSFKPSQVSAEYRSWPRILDLCADPPSNGLMEKRSGALIDIDRTPLEQRMQAYFNANVDWDSYSLSNNVLTTDRARFNAKKARAKAIEEETFQASRVVRYALRPLDSRWCYYTGVRPVWNEPRPKLWKQVFPGNSFLLTRFRSTAVPEGLPVSYTNLLSDDHYMTPDGVAVPFELPGGSSIKKVASKKKTKNKDQLSAFDHQPEPTPGTVPNLSEKAKTWASQIGITDIANLLWFHVLAVCCSPAYLTENADGVMADWPRVPLPTSEDLLEVSAGLGRRVAVLLDTENGVECVTTGNLPAWLKLTGQLHKANGQPLNEAEDLKVTAGWGHRGKGGVTMPGQGKALERERTSAEINSLLGGKSAISEAALAKALGATTYDVYLNDACFWKNVPSKCGNSSLADIRSLRNG
jgi:predicted helicase